HELKHLIVVSPGVILDPVKCQRIRRAAAALIQRRHKARFVLHLLRLLGRAHRWSPSRSAPKERELVPFGRGFRDPPVPNWTAFLDNHRRWEPKRGPRPRVRTWTAFPDERMIWQRR